MARRFLSHILQVSVIPYFSGGDTEVNTRPGRTTTVRLNADRVRVSNDKRYVFVRVDFHIIENASNHTHLRYFTDFRIPLPHGWRNKELSIGGNARELDVNLSIQGKRHDWIEIPINDEDTIVQDARIKIDGPGNNDDENAELELWFYIPMNVN